MRESRLSAADDAVFIVNSFSGTQTVHRRHSVQTRVVAWNVPVTAKQKAAMGGRGLGEIRNVGSTLLFAHKNAFEVLELLAIIANLVAGSRLTIRIA